jgi:hypothetical protein
MTQSFDARIFNVVIPSGGTTTRTIDGVYEFSDATSIFIQSPATLDAGTYTIQVSHNGVDFATLNDGAADIAPPAAGKGRQYIEMLGAKHFRISGPTAAADRTFIVTKQWTA